MHVRVLSVRSLIIGCVQKESVSPDSEMVLHKIRQLMLRLRQGTRKAVPAAPTAAAPARAPAAPSAAAKPAQAPAIDDDDECVGRTLPRLFACTRG
jgi:hypothetical protein